MSSAPKSNDRMSSDPKPNGRMISDPILRARRARRRVAAGALLTAAALAVAACSPIKRTHGYTPRAEELDRIEKGVDTRTTVQQKLGRPSTTGSFDDAEWYYISQTTEAVAFYEPRVTSRTVVAITFDDAGRVSDVGRFGLEDGKVIDLVTRTTPTSGRKLTILQQIFSNVGRFNPGAGGEPPRAPGR